MKKDTEGNSTSPHVWSYIYICISLPYIFLARLSPAVRSEKAERKRRTVRLATKLRRVVGKVAA